VSEAGDRVFAILAVQPPRCVELARLVSLAARIEPELLRAMRLAFLPGSDASVEGDLWFSPLVRMRSAEAVVLDPQIAEHLRGELASEPELLGRVWAKLREVHRDIAPLLVLEERLAWIAARNGPDEELQAELGKIAATILRSPERSANLSAWILRELPYLPKRARATSAAWMLVVSAGARLRFAPALEGRPPRGLMNAVLPGLLPENLPKIEVGLRFRGSTLELGPARDQALAIQVPETNPLFVEVRGNEDAEGQVVTLEPDERKRVEVRGIDVRLRTLDGEEYRLKRSSKPSPRSRDASVRLPSFSWLHLSDLQLREDGGIAIEAATTSSNMRMAVESTVDHIDAVIITGDLLQTGSPAEAARFIPVADNLLSLPRGAPVLVVPGNHDADRREGMVIGAESRRLAARWHESAELRDAFWKDPEQSFRRAVVSAFRTFAGLQRRLLASADKSCRLGILPGDFSVTMNGGAGAVGIVGLNSAFMTITGRDDGWLDLDVRQIRAVCGDDPDEWASRHDLTIFLTHHSPDWLHPRARERFSRDISPPGRFDVHLFSSVHSTATKIVAGRSPRRIAGPAFLGLRRDDVFPLQLGFLLGTVEFWSNGRTLRLWQWEWSDEHGRVVRSEPSYAGNLDPRRRRGAEPIYIRRAVDDRVFNNLNDGGSCFLIGPYRSGKTALIYGVRARLEAAGIETIVINFGSARRPADSPDLYALLLRVLAPDIPIGEGEIIDAERFAHHLEKDILRRRKGHLVVFVDDVERLWPSVGGELLGVIRFARGLAATHTPATISFCLAASQGAIPARWPVDDLVEVIPLRDISFKELSRHVISSGDANKGSEDILRELYRWTQGEPWSTVALLGALRATNAPHNTLAKERVTAAVARLLDTGLPTFGVPDLRALELYRRILEGDRVPSGDNVHQETLLRLGLAKVEGENLVVRSPLYAKLHDLAWIEEQVSRLSRERSARTPRGMVLIAGSSDELLDPLTARLVTAIAQELAEKGYGLVTREAGGVYQQAAQSFLVMLEAIGEPPAPCATMFARPDKSIPAWFTGTVVTTDNPRRDSVTAADCLVLVQGSKRTRDLFTIAKTLGKPVFPLGGTGGQAERIFSEYARDMPPELRGRLTSSDFEKLNQPLHEQTLRWLVTELMGLLEKLIPSKRSTARV
jgi:hypothetical protein